MRIVVVGAGAMGSIYGARLSAKNSVTLIDTNQALVDRINADGVTLEENGVDSTFHPSAQTNAEGLVDVDLVILFTKSLYSVAALENIQSAIGRETCLMSLQNGAGHERILSRFVDSDHLIIGTTEDNGAVLGLGRVHHGGKGGTNIGMLDGLDRPILHTIKETFDSCGFSVRIKENIQQLVWDKLMTNASLSALTAVLQCDMSFIASNEFAWTLCCTLIAETISVATAMGLSFNQEEVEEKVKATSLNNPGGYTSIMMDIKNGRKTEVDTISGAVLAAAAEHGVSVPHMETVVNLIHALEGR